MISILIIFTWFRVWSLWSVRRRRKSTQSRTLTPRWKWQRWWWGRCWKWQLRWKHWWQWWSTMAKIMRTLMLMMSAESPSRLWRLESRWHCVSWKLHRLVPRRPDLRMMMLMVIVIRMMMSMMRMMMVVMMRMMMISMMSMMMMMVVTMTVMLIFTSFEARQEYSPKSDRSI